MIVNNLDLGIDALDKGMKSLGFSDRNHNKWIIFGPDRYEYHIVGNHLILGACTNSKSGDITKLIKSIEEKYGMEFYVSKKPTYFYEFWD